MKIAWFCIPADGHTNPTLGLVKELTSHGHEVIYFSFNTYREKIESAGGTFISCDGGDFTMEDDNNGERIGNDMAYGIELIVNSTLYLDKMVCEKVTAIKPDVIVSDSVAFWGKLIAKKLNIPYVSSTTTLAFNQYSAKYMENGSGSLLKMLFKLPKINKQMKKLKESGYPIKSFLEIIGNNNTTHTIVFTSKFFQPCAETFSERYHFIGPIIRPIHTPMKKTAEVTIYISLGTVLKNKDFYDNCIKSFVNTPYQIIISMGKSDYNYPNLPNHIEVYPSVDQMAVLEITDIFITHCGMNSVSEGLYYGTPLLMYPKTTEQKAVAMRVDELGAGIALESISPKNILNSTNDLLDNPSYMENAMKISQSFKSCGGVKEARLFLESIVK